MTFDRLDPVMIMRLLTDFPKLYMLNQVDHTHWRQYRDACHFVAVSIGLWDDG